MYDVVVCDYGVGNLFNVYRALEFLDFNYKIDSDGSSLKNGRTILIPGVAAFGEGITNLQNSGQFDSLKERDLEGVSIVGLCLGAQMMLSSSAESEGVSGLGLIEGSVDWLDPKTSQAPHQGWAELEMQNGTPILHSASSFSGFYFFSHGYYMSPSDPDQVVANVRVGDLEVPAVVAKDNKLGIQFHPERSGQNGLRLLKESLLANIN